MPVDPQLLQQNEENFDANFKGPVSDEKRKCTDGVWSVLFAIFWVGMFVVGGAAISSANSIGGYDRVLKGYQYDGKICGSDDSEYGAGKDYKFLYYFDLSSSGSLKGLCVTGCPTEAGQQLNGRLTSADTKESVDVTVTSLYAAVPNSFGGYCYPNASSSSLARSAGNQLQELIVDMSDAAGLLAITCALAVLFAAIFMVMLFYCGGIIVWAAIVATLVGLSLSGYYTYYLGTCGIEDQDKFSKCGTYTDNEKTALQVIAYIIWAFAALFLIFIVTMRKRIQLAIKLIALATTALRDMPWLFGLPVVKVLMFTPVLAYWIAAAGALGSAGTLENTGNATFGTGIFNSPSSLNVYVREVAWDKTLWGMFFYHLFGLFWTLAFFVAVMHYVLSYAGVTWYFAEATEGGKQLEGNPTFTGIKHAFGKHGGTLAFGSFLVAFFEMIRAIVTYLAKKAKKKTNNNKIVACFCCILLCCVKCVERCMKYVTNQAYIFTAIFGTPLCTSVHSTMAFVGANFGRVVVLQYLGDAVSFIGKLFVVGMTSWITYLLMVNSDPWKDTIDFPITVMVCAMFLAYFLAIIFVSVFGRMIDTLLVAFVADEKMSQRHGTQMKAPTGFANDLPQADDAREVPQQYLAKDVAGTSMA